MVVKIVLSMVFIVSSLLAKDYTLSAKYSVGYGFFGKIGEADADLKVEKSTYKIKIEAKAIGLVKVLSKNRIEVYESTGVVKDGKFLPNIFISSRSKGDRRYIKRYLFDHKKEEVTLLKTTVVDGIEKNSKTLLPYYAKDDILTLFFNLKYLLQDDFKVKDGERFTAVGANKTDGRVEIKNIDKSQFRDIAKLLKRPNHLLAVTINQKIFASDKGEMFINVDDDGICISALLKDVIMFGDIRGELVSLKRE